MRSKVTLTLICMLAVSLPAFPQDLGQLLSRASQFWELRKQSNRPDALRFVEAPTQRIFLENPDSPISSFKVVGFEFSDDPGRVDVLVRVRSLVPRVGELDRIAHETWIWKDGQWLMHAAPPPSMFDSDKQRGPTTPILPVFKVQTSVVDAGRHSQGDMIEGKIPFQAVREEIVVIRPLVKIPGLSIGSPVWTGASEGYLPYQWDTTLVSQSIDTKIPLEARATSDARVPVDIQFRVRIDGRIGFKQVPEIVDPTTAGQVELQIQNLTAKPLKIFGVVSQNRAYVVDENVPESIEPGKSGRLLVRYIAQRDPVAASLSLTLSEALNRSGITTVPLNVKLAEEKRSTLEDLKRVAPATANPPLLPK